MEKQKKDIQLNFQLENTGQDEMNVMGAWHLFVQEKMGLEHVQENTEDLSTRLTYVRGTFQWQQIKIIRKTNDNTASWSKAGNNYQDKHVWLSQAFQKGQQEKWNNGGHIWQKINELSRTTDLYCKELASKILFSVYRLLIHSWLLTTDCHCTHCI